MERQTLISEIIGYFTRLESAVSISNSNGLTDINSFSEDFFCRLLNKILDLKLINLNTIKPNFPSVDLGDSQNKTSVQITSDGTSKKIKDTIKKFDEHLLYNRFNKLIFIIISNKKTRSKSKISGPKNVSFDPIKDVIDLSGLVTLVRKKEVEDMRDILDILKKELDSSGPHKSEAVLANEVQTIGDLITFLSKNKNLDNKSRNENPDPEKKIEHRFSSQSTYLKSQIVDLLPRYSLARSEIEDKLGLDPAMVNFIRDFLRAKSDAELTRANGDPKKALDNLTEYFEKEISKNGKEYDYLAIRFYVLDELIKCNVFPN